MRLLVLFLVIYAIVVFQSDWDTDIVQHQDAESLFKYHQPPSITSNSINRYSLIHFFQYAILSYFKFLKLWHIAAISIVWEIFELYTHFEWGRESWLNKGFDIFFNIGGFQFGRRLLFNKTN